MTKNIALELLLKINTPGLSVEKLNELLEEANKHIKTIGDDGSKEFQDLKTVVDETNHSLEQSSKGVDDVNKSLSDTSKNLKDTKDSSDGANKATKTLSGGFKAVGTAMRAMGLALIIEGYTLLKQILGQNQVVVDLFASAMGAVSLVLNEVVQVVTDVVTKVSESSKGFEGLTKVLDGLLTIGLTPFKMVFNSIVLGLKTAQLAWEDSFFGGGDEEKMAQLKLDITEVKDEIAKTGKDAIKAGIDVAQNLSKAGSELGGVVSGVVAGIGEISVTAAMETARANNELSNASKIAAAQQAALVEQYDRDAERLRQARDEERNGIVARTEANEQLLLTLEKQKAAMIAVANQQIASAQAEFDANQTIENRVALIDAETNKKGILAQIEGFISEQKMNAMALDREQLAMNKQLEDSEANLANERKMANAEQIQDELLKIQRLQEIAEERQQDEMLRLETILENTAAGTQAETDAIIALNEFREASRIQDLELQAQYLEEVNRRGDEQVKKTKENAEKEAAAQMELNQLKYDAVQSTLSSIASLVDTFAKDDEASQRKAFQVQKAISIAQAGIDTYASANAIFKSVAGSPVTKLFPAAPFIAAGSAVAAGLANVAKIGSQQFGGGAQGGNQPPPPDLSQGLQPIGFEPRGLDVPQNNSRVFVVETDITNTVKGVEGIYQRATVVE